MPITPEGMLLIPEIGPVEVSGISLEKAAEKIKRSIMRRYRNVQTNVSLVELRTFRVYIGGGVVVPGAYPATAVTRVSEIVGLAGGFWGYDEETSNFDSQFEFSDDDEQVASKRNVLVYRQNGDTLKADILRFEVTGQTEYNPTLIDGDRIFVALKEMRVNLYGIFGAVRNPGYFEYSDVDSLADLFDLAHGLRLDADSTSIEIVRFVGDQEDTESIYVDLTTDNWNINLNSDDRVFIKKLHDFHNKHQVKLVGEFKYPGYYAIHPDSTYISEIIEKAGGFTIDASLDEAEMIRVSAEELLDPEYERLKNMLVADMTELEYEYFKIKSRSIPGRVSADISGLINDSDKSKDFLLRDGDVINVPKKSKAISVIGEVSNPGILKYSNGEDYRYYISAAGGYSDRARRGSVSIVKGVTGEWRKAKKGKSLEPGDTVLVPEKKKRDWWGFTKDTLAFIGNLATVYLVVDQATSK
jgi:protein involved in polysaccharide export with SLBB domain